MSSMNLKPRERKLLLKLAGLFLLGFIAFTVILAT